jgi:hypothetical protein
LSINKAYSNSSKKERERKHLDSILESDSGKRYSEEKIKMGKEEG